MLKQIVFTLLIFITACELYNKEDSTLGSQIVQLDSISFHTGMSINGLHSGFWEDKENDKRYFYFANLTTDKEIRIFSHEGELELIIPLDSAINSNESIQDFEFISLDTIVVIHEYTNKLSCINRKGIRWKTIDLNSLLKDPYGLTYEYSTNFLGSFLAGNNTLILKRYVAFTEEDMLLDMNDFDSIHTIRNWKSDQYLKIDQLFSDTPKFTTGFKMYQHFVPNDSLLSVIELPYYQIANNSVFSISKFSDSIYQLSINELNLKKAHLIESSKTKIGISAIKVGDYSIDETREKEREMSRTSGVVNGIFFNPKQKHYYVTVSKTTDLEFLEREKHKPWLLQIYDINFKKLQEIDFEDGSYYPDIIPTKRGFLLKKRVVNPKKYEDQKVTFHEFAY